jgi:hypothetical protein
MTGTLVVIKDVDQPNQSEFDLTNELALGQIITGITVVSIAPITSPALTVTASNLGSSIVLLGQGGVSNVTYSVRLHVTCTSPVETKAYTAAVFVQDSSYVSFRTKSPLAFKRILDQIDIGEAAVGSGVFVLPAGTDFTNSVVNWSLIDNEGTVYSQGNAYDYNVIHTSLASRLEAYGLINVPSNVAPTAQGHSYQVRWELLGIGSQPVYALEGIKVLGETTTPQGTNEAIEMQGDPAKLMLVLPEPVEQVSLSVYYRNDRKLGPVSAPLQSQSNDGNVYGVTINTATLLPSLESYSTIWGYRNSVSTGDVAVQREAGRLFIVTPSLLQAIEDMRIRVMKARTTLLHMDDVLFSPYTLLSWLRRGMDYFNGAGGYFTRFTMTNATGAVREYWLAFSEAAALEAQALGEAEKAFDFQGQAISLSRDVSEAYRTAAENIYNRYGNDLRLLKQNLARQGISGGDGDVENAGRGTAAKVGVLLTPISRYPRYGTGVVWGR